MEESPCEFHDAAAEDMEQGDYGAYSPCLDKQVLPFPPTSESICTLGASDHLKVGRFYEIDHSQLSPKSPDQLKFVRVVMVSDNEELQVSLRYPSICSLRTHFSEENRRKPDGKKIPALDEKFVMGSEIASKALYRRVPTEEFAEKRNSWSFWVAPSEENERDKSPDFTDEATNLASKKGSCWSELKFTGMVQWGKRRQVRFLGRHEEQKIETLSRSVKETDVCIREHTEREEGSTKKKIKKTEEKEAAKAVASEVRMTRKSKRNQSEVSGVQKSKKAKYDKQNKLAVYNKKKKKITVDRWSAERYKLAEENMLKVMKAKGGVFGNPILRPALRSEARKLIGDTGLLDHLLKHMAGKVAPGGTERFRRRHNAEGAMEYWLESADLVNIRREAGVQDPYWTPPSGWKLGDNPSQDPICAKEFREIKEEMSKLKQNMLKLVSKNQEEELAIVTTPNSCLSSLTLDNDRFLVPMQDMYIELVNKKAKIEETLKEISSTLSGFEEQLGMLKSRLDEPIMSESVMPPALLPGPTIVSTGIGGETEEEEEDKNQETKSGKEKFVEDLQKPESRGAEDKAAKIERLKSGFQICKPVGTFIWPSMSMSPQVVVQLDDHIVVPTPSSASSSSTSSHKLVPKPQPQDVPNPSSPVKPLAERRPVSTAILTHVTCPFSPHLSPPMATLGSKIPATEILALNLNETPPNQSYETSFCGTLTYQPALATMMPECPTAGNSEATQKEGMEMRHCQLQQEKENSSSSSSPLSERKRWWQLSLAGGHF